MDWRIKVELFEQIRREYEFGVGTIKGVARKFGVHRRIVRQAVANALPPRRKSPARKRPKLEAAVEFVDAILEKDRETHRKQRHTAHRIHERILEELPGCQVSESTVRRYVQHKKEELGLLARETFVPQSYALGIEAQVDWYEAQADLGGERQTLQVFCMRSMASAGSLHRAFFRATQQAFLEGHELGFRYFGGVFRVCRYDNLSSAVKKILRGREREETARFIAFHSHWNFAAEFCTPGEGHEKGGVEGEQGYFRRNHWVPIPQARDLDDLNEQLLSACRADQGRRIGDRKQDVGALMVMERDHLLPLAEEGFELGEVCFPIVDSKGCVKVRTNRYSVPLRAGTKVRVIVLPACIEVWHEGKCVARPERCYGRQQAILNLEHYLDVLERKPGALAGSTPLVQWREQGRWPESYDRLWQSLMRRHGKQAGTREMVELLLLGRQHGYGRLRQAVESALEMGSSDAGAVRYLLTAEDLERPQPELLDVGVLSRYERPLPVLAGYDELLSAEDVQ